MAEYGAYILLTGGTLADPSVRAFAEEDLRQNFERTQASLGRELKNFQFISQENIEKWPISEKSMRELGWSEEEIRDMLAWQDTQEWPKYQDSLAWRAEG